MTTAYRIFRIDKDGLPEVLFHPFAHADGSRSRKVPLDTVLTAEVGQVWNPGKRGAGPGFLSGWHSTTSLDEARAYLGRFKDPSRMAVARITIDGNVRPKPRATADVLLSDRMTLTSADWAARQTV